MPIASGVTVTVQIAAGLTTSPSWLNQGFESVDFSQVAISGAPYVNFNVTAGPVKADSTAGSDSASGYSTSGGPLWTATYTVDADPTAAGVTVGSFVLLYHGSSTDNMLPYNDGCWKVTAVTTSTITVEMTHGQQPYAGSAVGAAILFCPTQLSFNHKHGIILKDGGRLGAVTNLVLNNQSLSGFFHGIWAHPNSIIGTNISQATTTQVPAFGITGFLYGIYADGCESQVSGFLSNNDVGIYGDKARITGAWAASGNYQGMEVSGCYIRSSYFTSNGSSGGEIQSYGNMDIQIDGGLIGSSGTDGSGYGVTPAIMGYGAGNIQIAMGLSNGSDTTTPADNTVGNGNVYIALSN